MRTDKPITPENNLAKLPAPWRPLMELPRWAGWKFTQNGDGKWQKPPFRWSAPRRNASSKKLDHWCKLGPVFERMQANLFDGASFLLTPDGDEVVIDLDNCIDPVTGRLDPWAIKFVKRANKLGAYIEISPSGTGLHIWGVTAADTDKVSINEPLTIGGKQVRVEVYRRALKPMTVTGVQLPGARKSKKLANIDALVDWALAFVAEHKTPVGNGHDSGNRHDLDDIEQIVQNGAPDGDDRSAVFFSVVGSYFGQGRDADWITEHLEQYPDGIGAKYIEQNRLRREVERCVAKFQAQAAVQSEPVAAPAEKLPPSSRLKRKTPAEPKSDDDRDTEEAADDGELPQLFAHGDVDDEAPESWTIKGVMPTIGHGILGGQTSIGKTTILIDMAVRIATETPFLGHKIKRRSGTLIFAAEGSSKEMKKRVGAAVRASCGDDRKLPIQWFVDFPPLRQSGAFGKLTKMVEKARARLQREHDVDVGLVAFDTLSAAAGLNKANDENDASVMQGVMNQLRGLAQVFNCFVIVTDHHGKSEISGLRGSSSKEASSDLVLTCLGEKTKSGRILRPELAIRKNRSGPAGERYPFALHTKEVGTDADGDAITTQIVEWLPLDTYRGDDDDDLGVPVDPWIEGLRQEKQRASALRLKRVMYELLADPERAVTAPVCEDGTVVPMVPQKAVLAAYSSRTADDVADEGGDEGQTRQGKHAQFTRTRDRAEEKQLIGIGKVRGKTHLWLCQSSEAPDEKA